MLCKFPIYDLKGFWYWNTGKKDTDIKGHQSSIWGYLVFSHSVLVIAVQHLTVQQVLSQLHTQSEQNVMPSAYINSTPFGHKSFRPCLQQVKC